MSEKDQMKREPNPPGGGYPAVYPQQETENEGYFDIIGARFPLFMQSPTLKAELEAANAFLNDIKNGTLNVSDPKLTDLETKIDNLNQKLESVIEDGAVKNRVTGSNVGYDVDEVSAPQKGDDFLNLNTKHLYIYDGSKWVNMSE